MSNNRGQAINLGASYVLFSSQDGTVYTLDGVYLNAAKLFDVKRGLARWASVDELIKVKG